MDKKKTFKIVAATTTVAGGLYTVGVRLFASLAFDRKPVINFFGSGNRELTGLAKEGQDWLHEHDKDKRYMINREGMKLCAHYIPARDAKRTLIEFHGWHGAWDNDFSASSPFLHREGCNLLLIEERGQGESEGDEMTFGVKERFDVHDWVNWYQETIDSKIPIYLGGVSMGATIVLLTAADEFPPQVKAIFADCGFLSPYEIIRIVGKKSFHMPEHPMMESMDLYSRIVHGFCLKEVNVKNVMRQSKLPILFVHGKDDHFVPCWMTGEAFEACNSEKDIFLVEGAGHGMSFLVDTEGYLNKIRKFFVKYDGTR